MDALGGNGNNYYLYYDSDSGQFTVLVWDMNESLGQFWFSSTPNYELDPYYEIDLPWNHPLKSRFLENARRDLLEQTTYDNSLAYVARFLSQRNTFLRSLGALEGRHQLD